MHQMNSLRAILFLGAVIFFPIASATAEKVSNPELGYELTIPDGWSTIPLADLEAATKSATNGDAKPRYRYVAGYQKAAYHGFIIYPYILVQSTPYPNDVVISKITENDLQQGAAGVSGFSVQDMKKDLSPDAAHLLGDSMQSGKATYTTDPPAVIFQFSMPMVLGNIKALTYQLFGKHHVIQINCYSSENSWDTVRPEFQSAITGFHLSAYEAAPLSRGFLSTVMINTIIGAITGLLGALAVWSVRKLRSKPIDNPEP